MAKDTDAAKGGKKKLIMLVAGALVLGLTGGGFMVMKGGTAEAADADKRHAEKQADNEELGEIVPLEPLTLNLADGAHYLKVGVALQASAEADLHHLEAQTPRALDLVIKVLGGMTYEELAGPAKREKAKAELSKEMAHLFHDEVVGVYFTEFVMQ
jgi:flagellar FliL protein